MRKRETAISKHEVYILKAFMEIERPECIPNGSDMYVLDDCISGYCSQLLSGKKVVVIPDCALITADEKRKFSDLINRHSGDSKRELVIYYRLLTIVEEILLKYTAE